MTKHQDPCRLMAEQIWDHITVWEDEERYKEETVGLIAEAIREQTVVPELLLMLENIEATHLDTMLGAQIHKLLDKAKGKP